VSQQLLAAIGHYGLLIVFLSVLIDQIGLPIPAGPTVIVAGAMAADGRLPLMPVLAGSVIACLIADCGWYAVGQVYGIRVLRVLCRISLEPDSCVSQTQIRFERWGINSLLFAKFVPGLAIIAPPLAGAVHMGWLRFLTLSLLGALLWAGCLIVTGMVFKAQIAVLLAHLGQFGSIAAITVGTALAAYVAYKWWERARFFATLRMARIDVGELYDLMQSGGNPIVVDVRSSTARAIEPRFIPGALQVSLEHAAQHLENLPRDADIILYCTCPSEASAARVARVLMRHGFTKVRPLRGGLDAWVAAGYAVVVEEAAEPTP
jgi:membrane protein DedA with SNARE-associated domain/rhodanese-related sulfurtransferase